LAGLLPARLQTLNRKPFSSDANYQVFVDSLTSGRPLPTIRLWGLIEERLMVAFGNIWQRVLTNPDVDLDELIRTELDPLAQKLNRILE